MSNIDKRYKTVNLDIVEKMHNDINLIFSKSDVNTSDFFIRITKNKGEIDLTSFKVILYVLNPNKEKLPPKLLQSSRKEKGLFYCNLPYEYKNAAGPYECQILVLDENTNERIVTTEKFLYSVQDDLIDLDESEKIETEGTTKLTLVDDETGETSVIEVASFDFSLFDEEFDKVQYTITNNLTNAMTNNLAVKLDENATYKATIMANEGYKLSSVIVIMNSEDITEECYADGVINILAVTGDVLITVIAEKIVIPDSGGDSGGDDPEPTPTPTPTPTIETPNCFDETGTIDGNKYIYRFTKARCTSYGGDSGSASGLGLKVAKTVGAHNMPYGTKLYIPYLKGKFGNTDGIVTVTDTGGYCTDFDIFLDKDSDKSAEKKWGNPRFLDVYVISWGTKRVAWSFTEAVKFCKGYYGLSTFHVAWTEYIKYKGCTINLWKFKEDDKTFKENSWYKDL